LLVVVTFDTAASFLPPRCGLVAEVHVGRWVWLGASWGDEVRVVVVGPPLLSLLSLLPCYPCRLRYSSPSSSSLSLPLASIVVGISFLSISVVAGFKVSSCSKRKEKKTGYDKRRGPFS